MAVLPFMDTNELNTLVDMSGPLRKKGKRNVMDH